RPLEVLAEGGARDGVAKAGLGGEPVEVAGAVLVRHLPGVAGGSAPPADDALEAPFAAPHVAAVGRAVLVRIRQRRELLAVEHVALALLGGVVAGDTEERGDLDARQPQVPAQPEPAVAAGAVVADGERRRETVAARRHDERKLEHRVAGRSALGR